jgi:acyl carrier protein
MDTEGTVRRVVARLVKREDPASLPRDADVFRQLGIASSAALELLLSLEDELGVQIPDAAFNEARTIGALVDLAEKVRA